MELVRGRTVGEELRRLGPLPAARAEHMVRQAAAGLAAAHVEGIVHRDIKPDNLLLTSDGFVKVADFGIVRFVDDATTTLTSAGHIVGTSQFLSPERVLGQPAKPASDVYALGCVLYQLLTGRPPFVSENPASPVAHRSSAIRLRESCVGHVSAVPAPTDTTDGAPSGVAR